MKRQALFFFFSLLLGSIFLTSVVFAETANYVGSQIDTATQKVDQIGQAIENPVQTRDNLSNNYLKKAWGEILRDSARHPYLSKIMVFYDWISPYSDPVIAFCVGLKPVLSWYFFLVLAIWLLLVKYFYTFYEVLRDFSTLSGQAAGIISFACFVILIVLHFFQDISKYLADLIVVLISKLGLWYVQAIAILILFILLFLASKFSKQINILAEQIRKNKEKYNKELKDKQRALESEAELGKLKAVNKILEK